MLTVTVITVLKVDGDPKQIIYGLQNLIGKPTTSLEDATDEEEFEPILESNEREQECGEVCEGRLCSKGSGSVRKGFWEVVQVHDEVGVNKEAIGEGEKEP